MSPTAVAFESAMFSSGDDNYVLGCFVPRQGFRGRGSGADPLRGCEGKTPVELLITVVKLFVLVQYVQRCLIFLLTFF